MDTVYILFTNEGWFAVVPTEQMAKNFVEDNKDEDLYYKEIDRSDVHEYV